ncbi:hypothetical protein MAR_013946 [Mya arenaria]|uniref:Uncharacterized protein n=1 Tax=Mya arenaria TaxID=6604 RepID=A0ABY7G4J2_MYAAR|nr:hypothetical protein MAR_013946 [Mya arenaria]
MSGKNITATETGTDQCPSGLMWGSGLPESERQYKKRKESHRPYANPDGSRQGPQSVPPEDMPEGVIIPPLGNGDLPKPNYNKRKR